jgi:hypothetical protein
MAERAKYMSGLGVTRGLILLLRIWRRAGTPTALRLYVAMDLLGLAGALVNVAKVNSSQPTLMRDTTQYES